MTSIEGQNFIAISYNATRRAACLVEDADHDDVDFLNGVHIAQPLVQAADQVDVRPHVGPGRHGRGSGGRPVRRDGGVPCHVH